MALAIENAAASEDTVIEALWAPGDVAFRADPYAVYARIRAERPVCRLAVAGRSQWIASRYDDCRIVLSDDRLAPALPDCAQAPGRRLFASDVSRARRRQRVAQAFTPELEAALRPKIEELVNLLLERASKRRSLDVMADFACPIPVQIIGELLGVPEAHRRRLGSRIRDVSSVYEPGAPAKARAQASTRAVVDYFEDRVATRRGDPGSDLLSRLMAADGADRLEDDELVAVAVELLTSGADTTAGLIGNTVVALIDHPCELARLRAEPMKIDAAIEEALRFDSPLQLAGRVARQGFTLGDVRIPAGERVFALLGSANRDEEVFDRPDVFDLERTGPSHLTFGPDPRACAGAQVARLMARIAVGAVVERFPELELASRQLPRRSSALFRVLERLHLVV